MSSFFFSSLVKYKILSITFVIGNSMTCFYDEIFLIIYYVPGITSYVLFGRGWACIKVEYTMPLSVKQKHDPLSVVFTILHIYTAQNNSFSFFFIILVFIGFK